MWTDAVRLWAMCPLPDLVERLLGMLRVPPEETTAETKDLTFDNWSMGRELVSGRPFIELITSEGAWGRAWRNKFGEEAVLETASHYRSMVEHLGYTSIPVKWGVTDALAKATKTDKALVSESQERLREVQIMPEEGLSALARAHLWLARKIAASISATSNVAGIHAALIPPPATG